jgi:general stress protein 26
MDASTFDEIQPEFKERVRKAVYASMATVDRNNRPRSRIVHPIWDGPVGWVISWPESHKAKHLKVNPYVSLAYIADHEKPVYVDCVAQWIDEPAEKRRIWELVKFTPPPIGFDPDRFFDGVEDPYFGLLKLAPWRIELYSLGGESIIWRPR